MNTPIEQKKYKVFIACPIGADDSPERKRSDKLLKFVIEPVVKELLSVEPEEVLIRSDIVLNLIPIT